jgi:hypothetical protein
MTTPTHENESALRPASSATTADEGAAGSTELIHAAEADALPTSFGMFKPVGYVMMGLPTQAQIDVLVSALHSAGWPAPGVRQFAPRESVAELRAMVDNASPLAGFGYEITLLKPKGRVHNLVVEARRRLHGRVEAVLPAHQACDLSSDGRLVELERLFTAAAEGDVGQDIHGEHLVGLVEIELGVGS